MNPLLLWHLLSKRSTVIRRIKARIKEAWEIPLIRVIEKWETYLLVRVIERWERPRMPQIIERWERY